MRRHPLYMPSRRKKRSSRLVFLLVTVFLLVPSFFVYSHQYYRDPGPLAEPTTILFRKGTGFRAIVDQLADEGVIRTPLLFKMIAITLGDARKFNAGEYRFSSAISPRLVMDMIAEGRVVVHKLTIPEGLTSQQILALLNAEPALDGAIVGEIPEGSLLPNTFHFTYGDSRRDLISRMQEGMTTTLAELWPKRKDKLPLASEAEAVTLASIVERETGVAEERGRVAAVFINRLRKGMRLQTDPSVIYAIEKDKGALGRSLIGSDLKYDSPYNTYLNAGLPPGPISNPGRKAIEAVLNPPNTNDLYFVATGTGGHNFSATLNGHNANVREYKAEMAKKKTAE